MRKLIQLKQTLTFTSDFSAGSNPRDPFAGVLLLNAMNVMAPGTDAAIYNGLAAASFPQQLAATVTTNGFNGLCVIGSAGLLPFSVVQSTHRIQSILTDSATGADLWNYGYYGQPLSTAEIDARSIFAVSTANVPAANASSFELTSNLSPDGVIIQGNAYQSMFRGIPGGFTGTVVELGPVNLPGINYASVGVGVKIPTSLKIDTALAYPEAAYSLTVISQIGIDYDSPNPAYIMHAMRDPATITYSSLEGAVSPIQIASSGITYTPIVGNRVMAVSSDQATNNPITVTDTRSFTVGWGGVPKPISYTRSLSVINGIVPGPWDNVRNLK